LDLADIWFGRKFVWTLFIPIHNSLDFSWILFSSDFFIQTSDWIQSHISLLFWTESVLSFFSWTIDWSISEWISDLKVQEWLSSQCNLFVTSTRPINFHQIPCQFVVKCGISGNVKCHSSAFEFISISIAVINWLLIDAVNRHCIPSAADGSKHFLRWGLVQIWRGWRSSDIFRADGSTRDRDYWDWEWMIKHIRHFFN
jgi:hypothetical protein